MTKWVWAALGVAAVAGAALLVLSSRPAEPLAIEGPLLPLLPRSYADVGSGTYCR